MTLSEAQVALRRERTRWSAMMEKISTGSEDGGVGSCVGVEVSAGVGFSVVESCIRVV